MAGWISSKLKVAENLLQQIDQQAAESLGKVDNPRRSFSTADLVSVAANLNQPSPAPDSISSAPKFPLPKKSTPSQPSTVPAQPDLTKLSAPPSPSSHASSKPALDPTVIDWTELLSSPSSIVPETVPRSAAGSAVPRSSPLRVVKKSAKRGKGYLGRAATPPSDSSSFAILTEDHRDDDNEHLHEKSDNLLLQDFQASVIGESVMPKKFTNSNRSNEDVAKEKKTDLHINVPAKLSSGSDGDSYSNTDSSSGSDSEEEARRMEERRKRREHMLAEKASRAAEEAIKEKENIVARLELEKQSLEKIVEERARLQAKEASELQTSMIETMEAVDLEKQKHNSTRMEAFARMAELETQNAALAKSYAERQWNLEQVLNLVAELKQQIRLKEMAQEERRRRMSHIDQKTSSPGMLESLRKNRIEMEILDAEYSFTCDKIARLKEKTKRLEDAIEQTRREIMQPTEVEVELKKRLVQLTDYLIQKQTQVEALSSEKATLAFRMETQSRMLDENDLSPEDDTFESLDIETGRFKYSDYAAKAALRERIRSGRQRLGLVIRQLDAIFSAGAIFLRRNTVAQIFSFSYLLCLHLWVLYIMRSHSQISEGTSQGAVLSLETISNSSGH